MDVLFAEIFPSCIEADCECKVFFVPLIQIDHAVINQDYMLFRSTKLWTKDGDYKGSFFLYRNNNYTDKSHTEYAAHKKYLEKIIDNCTEIDSQRDVLDMQNNEKFIQRIEKASRMETAVKRN